MSISRRTMLAGVLGTGLLTACGEPEVARGSAEYLPRLHHRPA
ncbi:hypothetical protein [Yimella sp. cx-51]|nr:hypothetical protein [Yimella sp. cx-51]